MSEDIRITKKVNLNFCVIHIIQKREEKPKLKTSSSAAAKL